MKKGEVAVGVIGETLFPDRGYIVREDGKVLLKHAVPGQTVEYRVLKSRGEKSQGMVLSVVKPSPIETEKDPCPHCGECGGCLYQTVPYEMQREIKEKQLLTLLRQAAGPDFCWEGLTASPMPKEYRMKMEYSFGDSVQGGPLTLGMHKHGSHYDIVTTDRCRLVHEDFNRVVRATAEYFGEKKTPFFHKFRHDGYLRYLLVRRGTHCGEILVDLVTTSDAAYRAPEPGGPFTSEPQDFRTLLEGWKNAVLSQPFDGTVAGILHTVTDSTADAVIDQGTEILYGRDYFEETLSGLKFKITPFSFFQNNADGAELLYRRVGEYAGDTKGKRVFDLYSGTGTIAQLVAQTAEHTVGVEIIPEAVTAARENAARNGITNCEFIAGDVLKVLDSLETAPDVIILDPPRDGVHPRALKKLVQYGVQRIIYVSCKPSSLREDLEILREGGYHVTRCSGVDMFPQTPNAEAVLLLEKKN